MAKKIYLISSIINGEKIYKIGITRREVSERIKELKTGNPYEFQIESIFNADNYGNSIETKLHNKFKYKRIDREWFSLEQEDIDSFISDCESYYKIFDNLQNSNSYIQDRNITFK